MNKIMKRIVAIVIMCAVMMSTIHVGTLAEAATVYQVKKVILKNTKNIKVDYIQITGWKLTAKQKYWNKKMKQEAMELIKDAGKDDTIEMKYSVMTKQKDLLSIVGEGYMDYYGAAHPSSMLKTYNIDMRTGRTVTLASRVNTYRLAKQLVNTKKYTISMDGVTINDILECNGLSNDEPTKLKKMQGILNTFDKNTANRNAVSYGQSYWKNKKLSCI